MRLQSGLEVTHSGLFNFMVTQPLTMYAQVYIIVLGFLQESVVEKFSFGCENVKKCGHQTRTKRK